MKTTKSILNFSFCLTLMLATAAGARAQSLSGLWDATVQFGQDQIPFPIEFSQSGTDLAASFFNGDQKVTSTAGKLAGNSISVRFAALGTELKATVMNGQLKGTYGGAKDGLHEFQAKPHVQNTPAITQVPDINGVWYIAPEAKGEHPGRLIVKQKGPYLSASIVHADSDSGSLVGGFEDGKFVLNRFDGLQAWILQLVPKPDGTVGLAWKVPGKPVLHLTAIPLSDAIDDGLPQASDPDKKPHSKNPS